MFNLLPQAAILDRFEVMPIVDGLPIPFSCLTRRSAFPAIWDVYFVVPSADDVDACVEMFQSCASPRIGVLCRVYGSSDCLPGELRISFFVRAEGCR